MYGLVNKALEEMICSQYGEQKWDEVLEHAGLEEPCFVGSEVYPDDLTYKIVASASAVLQKDAGAILEAFGEQWSTFTANEGYGALFSANGCTFEAFLANLNGLHARVSGYLPSLCPPSFELERADDGALLLWYRSTRPGLAPMVPGLVRGLARRFSVEATIEHVPNQSKRPGELFRIVVAQGQNRRTAAAGR